MKRILLLALAAVMVTSAVASASILNDYFGVNLSVNNQGRFNMPWNPARGNFTHEDWGTDGNSYAPDPGPSYPLSEVFDIEAMYLDYDWTNNQLVYSIVTSMPNTGFNQVPWYPGYVFRAGDIRFQVGNQQYVAGTFGGFSGNLYQNPAMTYRDGHRGFAERGNPLLSDSNLGHEMAGLSNYEFSYQEALDSQGNSIIEHGYSTYLIEGRISFADIGYNANSAPVTMTLAMSCNNDIAELTAVPEPGTLALMGIGLVGLIGGRRKFKK